MLYYIFQQDWYSPDIEVIIRDSHEDSGLCGQIGVVRGVTPGKFHAIESQALGEKFATRVVIDF